MVRRDIVVIGASAGGVEVLKGLLAALRADFPASVFITVHTGPTGPGHLADILSGICRLPVAYVKGDEKIERGRVYVARPNLHLIIRRGHVQNKFLPIENGTRPAIDPMFRSAAKAYAKRVIGVVLTGNLDDGTDGLGVIKDEGGVAIVQDPKDAPFPNMPVSAISNVETDYVVPASAIPPLLSKLVSADVTEVETMVPDKDVREGEHVLTCPGCGGVLREYKQGERSYFECQVGHRYSVETMMVEQDRQVEEQLWGAVAMLRQKEEMMRTLASDARSLISPGVDPSVFQKQAEDVREAYETLSNLLDEKGPAIFSTTVPKDIAEAIKRVRSREKTKQKRAAASPH